MGGFIITVLLSSGRRLHLMLCAKFDGNVLTAFEVMVKKLFAYFLGTRCIDLRDRSMVTVDHVEEVLPDGSLSMSMTLSGV